MLVKGATDIHFKRLTHQQLGIVVAIFEMQCANTTCGLSAWAHANTLVNDDPGLSRHILSLGYDT